MFIANLVRALPVKTLFAIVCLLIAGVKANAQDIAFQQHCVDSILTQIEAVKDDTNKVHLWLRAAYHEYWIHPDEAHGFAANGMVLSQQLGYVKGYVMCFMMYGNQCEYSKQYGAALGMYDLARFHAEANKFYSLTHDAYISMINMHFYKGEYVYALDLCLRGLKLARDSSDLQREAMYTNLSGFIYRNMKQTADEEHAFMEYSRLAHQSGDSLLVASACVELAQVMMEKEYYDSAEVYLDSAYKLYSGHYETHRRAFIHYLRAKIYLQTGAREAASVNAKTAISISKSAPSDEFDVARYYITAGKALFQMRLFDEALLYLDTGLQISRRIQHKENTRDAYQLIAYSYELKGNIDSAYHYLSLYDVLQDSLLNEENLRTIAEMKAKYDLSQRDEEIRKLEQEAIQKAEKEEQDKLVRNLALGIVSLTLIIGFLFYNRYRLKQKAELQLTINKQQNEMFQGIISAQEKERQRIAGDLHDGLGSLLSTAKLQLQLMGNTALTEEQKKHYESALDLVNRSSQDLRSISHSIMPAPLKKLGLVAALESVIAGLNVAGQIEFQLHAHNMSERIEGEKELALYNITMELINNAAKHSGAKLVSIQFIRHENTLSLVVEDDGKGFDPKQSVDGIGLKNIRERVSYFQGQMEVDSKSGGPTIISIEVPVS